MIRVSAPWDPRGEGSFVTVKIDPPPFLGGVTLSRYTGLANEKPHTTKGRGHGCQVRQDWVTKARYKKVSRGHGVFTVQHDIYFIQCKEKIDHTCTTYDMWIGILLHRKPCGPWWKWFLFWTWRSSTPTKKQKKTLTVTQILCLL